MKSEVKLRSATIHDAELLLSWRNDPSTRSASHNTQFVKQDDHSVWLKGALQDPNRLIFIAEKKCTAVGVVRADYSNGSWKLSWTVAPKNRGQGIGKSMVALVANSISDPIRAEVKVENRASAKIAEHAGMYLDRQDGGILHYIRS